MEVAMNVALRLIFAIAAITTCRLPAQASVVSVSWDGSGDYETIQEGITAASVGDTVMVQCGTYAEHDIQMKRGVTLASTTGDPCVTINAGGLGRVMECEQGSAEVILRGLRFENGTSELAGGAISFRFPTGPALIEKCEFVGNTTHATGGALIISDGSLTCLDCLFEDNHAESGGAIATGYGSGTGTDLNVSECVFRNNEAAQSGGVAMGSWRDESTEEARFTNCLFESNSAGRRAGAICTYAPQLFCSSCSFVGNRVQAAWGEGGAVCVGSDHACFTDCTFASNTATYASGIDFAFANWSTGELHSTVIAFGVGGTAIRYVPGIPVELFCCDVYQNEGGDWVGDIADQNETRGNFSADPLFCGLQVGNLALCANSPCLPGNHPSGVDTCGVIGAHGAGCPDCDSPVKSGTWTSLKAMFR
jgi:predicted outer membrane repeat protein